MLLYGAKNMQFLLVILEKSIYIFFKSQIYDFFSNVISKKLLAQIAQKI